MQHAKFLQYDLLSILVVDDQPMVRALLEQALARLGVSHDRIYQADDGMSALQALNAHRVDAVLCDVNMGVMNGLDLLKEVRMGSAYATPSTVPFILFSGSAGDEILASAVQLNADGLMDKSSWTTNLEQVLVAAFLRPCPEIAPQHYARISTGTDYDLVHQFSAGDKVSGPAYRSPKEDEGTPPLDNEAG